MEPQISKLGTKSALWLLFASLARDAVAHPYPRDDLHAAGYGYLMPRECHQYCGYNNMFCCEEGTECYTYGGYAGCSSTAGGGWARFTTTWTLTQTFTSTYDSWIPATTAPPGSETCVPPEGSGWIACGKICCASWQYCASEDHCVANPGAGPAPEPEPTTVTSGDETLTTGFSAPYRVTSGTRTATATTATNTGASTTTGAVSPGGSDGGLSGGAIAGIVVGTIAGVALLLLLCACCVARGLWHGLLAIFGLGKKDETSEEERYQRRGSYAHRESHGSWFGGRPSSAAARKEKSKGKGLLGLGAFLGMLALLLGLRREKKKEEVRSRSRTRSGTRIRSDVSSSYWSESYTVTSPSSRSSDRRTRHTRHSRTPSRVTRTTHTHTRVSRSRPPSTRSQRSPRP